MGSWNDRLREAMGKTDVTAADLARITGLSPAGIKKWVDGLTQEPRYTDVVKACSALGVAPSWLMEGKEQALATADAPDAVVIERIDLHGSCGSGTPAWDAMPRIDRIYVTRSWFERMFAFYDPAHVKIITAAGNSMTPVIEDGDAAFIDIADKEYIRDGIYAAIIDGDLYIKRVRRSPGKLEFVSANPDYGQFEITANSGDHDVLFLGRVIKSLNLKSL